MDSAMRDLEQIRERDDESEGRPLALIGLLIGVTMALVFAMGSLVGWTQTDEGSEEDPLARLDRAAGLTVDGETEAPPMPEVDPSTLSFPQALAPADERPEVAAALAAAAAELAHPEPLEDVSPSAVAMRRGAALAASETLAETLPSALPAAVAAGGGGDELARAAARDPLVASSLPERSSQAAAPAGRDGEYTIQVVSYDSQENAESFAATLRARGHRAFVMSAEVEDRGTMWRVRIGPFERMREAQAYRRQFEQDEDMNTLLVRRRQAST